jgi:hypothetical protein
MRLLLTLLSVMGVVWAPSLGGAETEGVLSKLMAPGPLIQAHHKLEDKDCLKCHSAGKGVPDEKCLQCHKVIKSYVDNKKGFHGLTQQSCFECHSDHKGRTLDSLVVDQNTFDHTKMTGYSLDGKHQKLKCAECHTGRRGWDSAKPGEIRYFGKGSSCVSCHAKNDIHHFTGTYAKKDCNACHNLQGWKTDISFDHNRDTRYKLEGHHAEIKCLDCHTTDKAHRVFKYQWPHLEQQKCLSCHEDTHKNNLSSKFRGGQCLTCHTQETWKLEHFDHAVTKYPLRGKHAGLECTECHKQKASILKEPTHKFYKWAGLKNQCLTCHKDVHHFGAFKSGRLKNPNNCLTCHTEQMWKPAHDFDHNKDTSFVIDGAHTELKCEECHVNKKNAIYKFPTLATKTCETCHKNPHGGAFGVKIGGQKCTSCHVTQSWYTFKDGKGFDHSKTRFPLTGAHVGTRCNDCHVVNGKQIYKFKTVGDKFCIDCHKNIHIGQFANGAKAQSCSECHGTQNFKTLGAFDHKKTQFPLVGAHEKTKCQDCHLPGGSTIILKWPNIHTKKTPVSFRLGKFHFPTLKQKDCLTCHQDIHGGQLGTRCTQCHTETAWKPPQFDHNKSRFPLLNKHANLKCNECHKPLNKTILIKGIAKPVVHYKPLGTNCNDCHQDYHKGQLGNRCDQCHSDKGWKPVQFDHAQSRFPLKFKHADVKCSECHKPENQMVTYKGIKKPLVHFKPIDTQCTTCHKDPHQGNFGKKCEDCHSEKGWSVTKDFHKNFTLSGVHYTLQCAECHKDGRKLAGTSEQCFTCHQKDDVHRGTLLRCQDCHTQHFWEVSKFKHSLTNFPLLGAHRTLDCMACHKQGVYQGLSSQCVSCHMSDYISHPRPEHSGNLDCAQCHRNQFAF